MDAHYVELSGPIYYEASSVREAALRPDKLLQHYHEQFEIYYLESGSCNYLVDNKLYAVAAGDVVLIPGGIIHKTSYDVTSHKRILLYCAEQVLPRAARALVGESEYVYRNPEINKRLFELLKCIEQEYHNPDGFSMEMMQGYLQMFFVLLCRNRNCYINSRTGNMHVERILDFLHENFDGDISLNETAKQYCISPEHLSRIFKKETGLGFSEYLTAIRMRHAEQLLKQGEGASVAEIALRCGYNDSNYFSKTFKAVHGVAPLKYRKAQR